MYGGVRRRRRGARRQHRGSKLLRRAAGGSGTGASSSGSGSGRGGRLGQVAWNQVGRLVDGSGEGQVQQLDRQQVDGRRLEPRSQHGLERLAARRLRRVEHLEQLLPHGLARRWLALVDVEGQRLQLEQQVRVERQRRVALEGRAEAQRGVLGRRGAAAGTAAATAAREQARARGRANSATSTAASAPRYVSLAVDVVDRRSMHGGGGGGGEAAARRRRPRQRERASTTPTPHHTNPMFLFLFSFSLLLLFVPR